MIYFAHNYKKYNIIFSSVRKFSCIPLHYTVVRKAEWYICPYSDDSHGEIDLYPVKNK